MKLAFLTVVFVSSTSWATNPGMYDCGGSTYWVYKFSPQWGTLHAVKIGPRGAHEADVIMQPSHLSGCSYSKRQTAPKETEVAELVDRNAKAAIPSDDTGGGGADR